MTCFKSDIEGVFTTTRTVSLPPTTAEIIREAFEKKYMPEIKQISNVIRQYEPPTQPVVIPAPVLTARLSPATVQVEDAARAEEILARKRELEIREREIQDRETERKRLLKEKRELERKGKREEAAKMNERISRLDDDVQRLNQEAKDLNASVRRRISQLRDRNAELTDSIFGLSGDLDNVRNDVGALEESHKQLKGEVKDLGRSVQTGMSELRQRDAELTRDISDLGNTVGDVQEELSELGEDVGKLRTSHNKLSGNVTKLAGSHSKLSKNVSALGNTVSGVQDNVASLDKRTRRISGDVSGLQEYQTRQETRQTREFAYAADQVEKAIALHGQIGTDVVRKWNPNNYGEAGGLLEEAKQALSNGFLPEVFSKLERAFQTMQPIPQKAYADEQKQMELKEKTRILYRTIKETGCKRIAIRQLDPKNPRSPAQVYGELMCGKKFTSEIDLDGLWRTSLQGVYSDREAHTVWDAIEAVTGKEGLVIARRHMKSNSQPVPVAPAKAAARRSS